MVWGAQTTSYSWSSLAASADEWLLLAGSGRSWHSLTVRAHFVFVHRQATVSSPKVFWSVTRRGESLLLTVLFFVSLHINHNLVERLLNFDPYLTTNYPVQFENNRGMHEKVRKETRRHMDALSEANSCCCAEAGQASLWIFYLKSWLFQTRKDRSGGWGWGVLYWKQRGTRSWFLVKRESGHRLIWCETDLREEKLGPALALESSWSLRLRVTLFFFLFICLFLFFDTCILLHNPLSWPVYYIYTSTKLDPCLALGKCYL